MRLKDKVALVTGAGSGFGAGMAEVFAREGAKVVIVDINDDGGRAVREKIQASGGSAEYVHADVTQRREVRKMMQATIEHYNQLDILVNNAGVSHRNKSITEVTEEEFELIYAVNVKAIYLAVQEALPLFKENGGGNIITTSSTAALRPRPGLAVYNSSKGAANNLTKSLALELAADNIRVNAICPVIGETGLLETFMGVADTPENRKKFEASIPLGRFSTPLDIANTALFLASDESAFLTGVAIEVDGGRCI